MIQTFKKSLKAVKKNKWLFLLLFFTQLAFIIILAMVQLKYQVAVVQNFNDILVPLETANYNTTEIQMGMPFVEDTAQILNTWEELKTNFQYLIIFSFLTFIIFNGFNWALSHYMIKKQPLLKLWGKFIALSFIFFIPYSIIIFLIFESPLFQNNPITSGQIMMAIAALFLYFALIAFAFMNFKFKKIFRKTFWEIGIKKFYWVLLAYLIIVVILSAITYLIYMAVNFWHISLVALFIILLVLSFNILRILLINFFSEIS